MEIIIILCCLTFSNSSFNVEVIGDHINLEPLAAAIHSILLKFFIEKSIKFDVIIFGTQSKTYNDIIDEVLRLTNGSSNVIIKNYPFLASRKLYLQNSALIIIKNFQSFKNCMETFELGNLYPKEIKFLIYMTGYSLNLPGIKTYTSDKTIFLSHVYYVFETPSTIVLTTYENFLANNCNNAVKIVNYFSRATLKWTYGLDVFHKFRNFNECPLQLIESYGIPMNYPAYNREILECFRNGIEKCALLLISIHQRNLPVGLFPEILKMMSLKSNFTPLLTLGKFEKVRNFHNYKFPLFQIEFAPPYLNYFQSSYLLDTYYLILLTPSEYYTNYEKLWLPFDETTWMFLLLTFVIAFNVIFILKFIPESLRLSFYGGPVESPALNVIHIFFGISQMKLPDASIPRFILMLFIVFCLIFRTCYQSMMFEFITTDMRKPPPATIEDLIEMNYTIVSCRHTYLREIIQSYSKEKIRFVV